MNTNTRKLVQIAIIGALAYILMFFAFPIIPFIPYVKVDFSDVPLLLLTIIQGPLSGIAAAFIRSVLHYIQTGGDAGYPIGDLASFLATIAFILPVYYVIRPKLLGKGQGIISKTRLSQNKGRMLFGYLCSILSLTIVMSLLNYFVLTPFYMAVMNFPIPNMGEYILKGIIPFNLIKGILVSAAAHVILVKILPLLSKNMS